LVIDRRQQIRHALSLEASFVWTDDEGIEHEAQGITRDISPKGLFIYTDFPPPPKVTLNIEVALSREESETIVSFPLRMKASALVLRVDPPTKSGLQGGFATVNNSFELLRGDAVVENDWKLWKN
jgi:hypothetical protein